jgi:hypothetical protein
MEQGMTFSRAEKAYKYWALAPAQLSLNGNVSVAQSK